MNSLQKAKVQLYSELLKIPPGDFDEDDDVISNELALMYLLAKDKDIQKNFT